MGYADLSRITLSPDRSSFVVSFPFDLELVGKMHQVPRARWDPDTKTWVAPLSRVGGRVLWSVFGRESWDPAAIEAVKALPKPIVLDAAPIVIPPEIAEDRVPGILPTAPKMFDYQKLGAAFMLQNRRVFNADAVGAGKSAQAITAALAGGCDRILVVCLNFLVPNWDVEIQKWTGKIATIVRAGKKELLGANAADIGALVDASRFCIVHYEILFRAEGVLKTKWDCVILDESHLIKSPTSARSMAAKKLNPKYFFLLTGTPVLNRPIELWSQLDTMAPGEFGSYYDFGDRYCKGELVKIPLGVFCPNPRCRTYVNGVWRETRRKTVKGGCFKCHTALDAVRKTKEVQAYNGAANLDELSARLKPYMISRKRGEILKDLPPFTRVDRLIELSDEAREAYETLKEDLVEYLTEYEEKSLEEAMKSATSEPLVKAGKFRQLLSGAKLERCADEVRQVLAAGSSVVAFTCYVESAKKLRHMIANGTGTSVNDRVNEEAEKATEFIVRCVVDNQIDFLAANPFAASSYVNCRAFIARLAPQTTETEVRDLVTEHLDLDRLLKRLEEDGVKDEEKMRAYVHTGENSLDEKSLAISDFVENPGSAFVATIQSAGIGLNRLVAASYMFFVDLPWTPAEIVQAEGRINRIGQTADKVTYIRYFASDTYDAQIMAKLREKQDIFDKLIGQGDGLGINANLRVDDFRKGLLRELFVASRKKRRKKRRKKGAA